jgi:hypothetical protein
MLTTSRKMFESVKKCYQAPIKYLVITNVGVFDIILSILRENNFYMFYKKVGQHQ